MFPIFRIERAIVRAVQDPTDQKHGLAGLVILAKKVGVVLPPSSASISDDVDELIRRIREAARGRREDWLSVFTLLSAGSSMLSAGIALVAVLYRLSA